MGIAQNGMLSQLAQVFSSQGVLVQGTRYAPAPNRTAPASAQSDQTGNDRFESKFAQASSRLELSERARKELAQAKDGAPVSADAEANAAGFAKASEAGKEIRQKAVADKGTSDKSAGDAAGESGKFPTEASGSQDAMAPEAQTESRTRARGAYARGFAATGRAYSAFA